MTKEECLEKYKEQLKENNDYMGMSSRTIALIENDKWAAFVISNLLQGLWEINEESKAIKKDLEELVRPVPEGSCLSMDDIELCFKELREKYNLDKSEEV